MVEERTTEVHSPDGRTQTHTTVVHEGRRGSGAMWVIIVLIILAIIAAIWAFNTFGSSEIAKDNAIAGAANEVGEAAGQIGDAAQDAARSAR